MSAGSNQFDCKIICSIYMGDNYGKVSENQFFIFLYRHNITIFKNCAFIEAILLTITF